MLINHLICLQINVSLKEYSNEANIVKDFLYHQGRSKIRDQLEKYIKDLKEGTLKDKYFLYPNVNYLIYAIIKLFYFDNLLFN